MSIIVTSISVNLILINWVLGLEIRNANSGKRMASISLFPMTFEDGYFSSLLKESYPNHFLNRDFIMPSLKCTLHSWKATKDNPPNSLRNRSWAIDYAFIPVSDDFFIIEFIDFFFTFARLLQREIQWICIHFQISIV